MPIVESQMRQIMEAGVKIGQLETNNFELRGEVERLRAENEQLKAGKGVASH